MSNSLNKYVILYFASKFASRHAIIVQKDKAPRDHAISQDMNTEIDSANAMMVER